jgi:hypothetical protein
MIFFASAMERPITLGVVAFGVVAFGGGAFGGVSFGVVAFGGGADGTVTTYSVTVDPTGTFPFGGVWRTTLSVGAGAVPARFFAPTSSFPL